MTIILIKASVFTEEERKVIEKQSGAMVILARIEKNIEIYDSIPPQIQYVPYQPYYPYQQGQGTGPWTPTNPPYQVTC